MSGWVSLAALGDAAFLEGAETSAGDEDAASSQFLDTTSAMSSDDARPSVSTEELTEHYRARGVLQLITTPAFVQSTTPLEQVNGGGAGRVTLLQACEEKEAEAARTTAWRRARHEYHKVIFPILRRASKAGDEDGNPFRLLSKDLVRLIAWRCVDERASELCAMFHRKGPIARERKLLSKLVR
jgi:hypothetical protein